MGGEFGLAGYDSKHTTDSDPLSISVRGWVTSYSGHRALRCKMVVKEGAEAPEVVTTGTLVEAGSTSLQGTWLYPKTVSWYVFKTKSKIDKRGKGL